MPASKFGHSLRIVAQRKTVHVRKDPKASAEITLKKVPLRDPDREQTAKSREKIEEFVKANHAQLWIQHDYTSGMKR